MLSQYSGEVPKKVASRSAVSAVIARLSLTMRLIRFAGVQPNQPGASLILNRNKLNNALIVQELLRPRVPKRRNHIYRVLLDG
jgi:hypothetical protein